MGRFKGGGGGLFLGKNKSLGRPVECILLSWIKYLIQESSYPHQSQAKTGKLWKMPFAYIKIHQSHKYNTSKIYNNTLTSPEWITILSMQHHTIYKINLFGIFKQKKFVVNINLKIKHQKSPTYSFFYTVSLKIIKILFKLIFTYSS